LIGGRTVSPQPQEVARGLETNAPERVKQRHVTQAGRLGIRKSEFLDGFACFPEMFNAFKIIDGWATLDDIYLRVLR
jgi:hypothetical protein